jgi:hypothetical protein
MNITKSDFVAMKFKYLSLKFEHEFQQGGYNENNAINLAAAATAVINCTNKDAGVQSVDCVDSNINEMIEEKKKLEESEKFGKKGVSSKLLQLRNKFLEKTQSVKNKIGQLTKKTNDSNQLSVSNRACDDVLATVASIFLAIIHHKYKIFSTLLNDLINRKINNCPKNIRTPEKKLQIVKYFLNVVIKLNNYLNLIGSTIKIDDIFDNAEYSKVVKDERKINSFIFDGIFNSENNKFTFVNNIKPINILALIDDLIKLKTLNDAEKDELKKESLYAVKFSDADIESKVKQLKITKDQTIGAFIDLKLKEQNIKTAKEIAGLTITTGKKSKFNLDNTQTGGHISNKMYFENIRNAMY